MDGSLWFAEKISAQREVIFVEKTTMANNVPTSFAEKYLQTKKEAAWTAGALLALILFWLAAGFGVSSITDAKIFSLPLWALLSTVGVWAAALVAVKLLLKFVFVDMDLSTDEHGKEGEQ